MPEPGENQVAEVEIDEELQDSQDEPYVPPDDATSAAPTDPAAPPKPDGEETAAEAQAEEQQAPPDENSNQPRTPKPHENLPRAANGQFTTEEAIAKRERETFERLKKGETREQIEQAAAKAAETTAPEKQNQAAPDKQTPAVQLTAEQRMEQVERTRAFRRAGLKDSVIKIIPPEDFAAEGDRLIKEQAKTDAKLRQAGRQAGSDNSPSPNANGTDPTAKAKTGPRTNRGDSDEAPAQATNAKDDLDEVLETLELEDPATADRIRKAVAARAPAPNAQPTEDQHDNAAVVDPRRAQMAEDRFELAVEALTPDFPALKDLPKNAEEFQALPADSPLVKFMQSLVKLDPHGEALLASKASAVQLLRDAGFIAFGPQIRTEAQRKSVQRNIAQRNGSPDAASVRAPQRKYTEDEWAKVSYEVLRDSGWNKAEAEKKLSRMRAPAAA